MVATMVSQMELVEGLNRVGSHEIRGFATVDMMNEWFVSKE